jgi:Holliday junction resolvase RusA-like endonuclease
VKLEAVFYFTRRPSVKRDLPTVPPDLDKVLRSLMDGITAKGDGVWKDDAQVVRIEVSKKYASAQAGVAVTITKYP